MKNRKEEEESERCNNDEYQRLEELTVLHFNTYFESHGHYLILLEDSARDSPLRIKLTTDLTRDTSDVVLQKCVL